MRKVIIEKLQQIEKQENVRILHAVESGSRAWGFESPDSDFDVRFIYVRPRDYYLKLEQTRDVLEFPINDLLDVNGWDLQKALRLLHRSNPSVFEWFKSPIVYRETAFSQEFIPLMENYFSAKSGLYHYLNMADGNYREYLRGEMVRAKKYFYALRPLLACRWILRTNTPPPMRFAELVAADLPTYLYESVQELLRIKMEVPELKLIPRVDEINNFIEEEIPRLKEKIWSLPEERRQGYDELNALFLKVSAVIQKRSCYTCIKHADSYAFLVAYEKRRKTAFTFLF